MSRYGMYKDLLVISIKKYLSSTRDALTSAALKMSALLLEGIGTHAVNSDSLDHETFQMKFLKLRHDLTESCSPSDIPVIAGEALQLMELYNKGVEKNTLAHLREMRAIVGMLTRTLLQETEGSESSVFHLQSIAEQIEKVYQIEDVRVVKLRLAETLTNLQEETSRQKEAAARLSKKLKETASTPVIKSLFQTMDSEDDPVSGLAGPRKAEMSIWSALSLPSGKYAVVFCVDRLETIRSRFGSEGGDQVLLLCGRRISEKLLPDDQLFRWTGPSFVAIVERSDPFDTVGAEIQRLASPHTVGLGDRAVQITIAASWTLIPLEECASLESVIEKVDAFIADRQQAYPPPGITANPVSRVTARTGTA